MNDDILKSVSQGSNGAYDEENRRIREISDELQRLCRLHEKEPRDGKGDGGRDMYVVDAEIKKLYVSECQTL